MVLDALRGFALFTIILANFPEFGLWTFLGNEAQAAFPTAAIDKIVRFLQYFLIDGKGYGMFSILFGCGFSIIIAHAMERGSSGIALFYRRMSLLLVIALCHLLLLWSGDILCLYAVLGMLLPLFHKLSNKALLTWATALLAAPVAIDYAQELGHFDIAAPLEAAWWQRAHAYGINQDNFATWLVDAQDYAAVSQFLMQGAIERMWEFVDGNRFPKILALFLLGYYIGRNKYYARLHELKTPLANLCRLSAMVAIPLSAVYAWHATQGHPLGQGFHSLVYFLSVVPMTAFYITAFCLLWMRHTHGAVFRMLAWPGRMALTNYIGQSVVGIAIYYGIGAGMGLRMGLVEIELTAVAVFMLQIVLSACWMQVFRFGPLEWLWRMLTYGRWFSPLKS